MGIDPSLVHRLFYPQVPLVMAAKAGARVSAMPVVSYLSVSERPPMVAVACAPRGYTCRLARKARCFSLSIVGRERSSALSKLATASGAAVKDKLAEAGLKYSEGVKLKVPVLDAAVATLECRLQATRRLGDHLLLVARVEDARAAGAFSGFWDYRRYRPVLYAGWQDGLSQYPGS
ncbi:MAG: flavin reductase family protein [Nitrososphaerota archaeon]|jgi:flavin reductase (DIM6/NTAB) family NADH-FMN oxidoreductase RutF|nr:flavin reductase family protein [Nitrososphaerota archaeon]MCL5672522.1 flavin reductase family protein [Nitrososphaerota archaeon]MDG6903711.1 flavin reductase family protein [Nitrososphaerota archaeon]MDG6911962.1 flavin reductase family protein [Nitrososphaerota archaeon]MDG6924560.1 flavin reductase family protein [Nitrososphaerota archaeon]